MAGPPPAPRPPLLLVCALGIEGFALRGALRRTGTPDTPSRVDVLSTGMGPAAARKAMSAAIGAEHSGEAATAVETGPATILVTGFCAGLAPGIRPGDVVVAAEVRDACGRIGEAAAEPCPPVVCPQAERLAEALVNRGLRVHIGPLASTDHVVRGQERAALHSGGAIAVDMESSAVLRAALSSANAPSGPAAGKRSVRERTVAAARVVVDTPEHELARFGTLRTGLTAYRHLRAAVPAFLDWHRTLAGTAPALTEQHPLSPEVS